MLLFAFVQEPDPPTTDPPLIALKEAYQLQVMGDMYGDKDSYRKAEAVYRDILRRWPESDYADTTMESLGDVLLGMGRTKEARDIYLEMTASDARKPDVLGKPYFRPKLFVKIGKTYEKESEWAKALENYEVGGRRVPFDGGCGTCVDEKALSSQTRLARCLMKLGRDDEAMSKCREILFETDGRYGGTSIEICLIAVEIAIRTGKFEEFEWELRTGARLRYQDSHIEAALEYLRLLRLRETANVARLFESVRKNVNHNSWFQGRWEPGSLLHVEALELIATLGDPAFDWLVRKAMEESFPDKHLALTAIAYFRNEKAKAFIQDRRWSLGDDESGFRRMLERIHAGKSRIREFPPKSVPNQAVAAGPFLILGSLVIIGTTIKRKSSGLRPSLSVKS